MIEQKATVVQVDKHIVFVEAERQSTCSQCSAKKGCGTGMLSKHVGQRFSRLSAPNNGQLEIGQDVMVMIPENALLSGALMMYLLPIISLFIFAIVAKILGFGELVQIIVGLLGLSAGFYVVSRKLGNKLEDVTVKPIED